MTALQICKAALEDASKALEQLSQIGPGHWPTTGRIVAEAGAKARAALEAAAKVPDVDYVAMGRAWADEMSGRQYGKEETADTRAWFECGWLRAIDAYLRGAR